MEGSGSSEEDATPAPAAPVAAGPDAIDTGIAMFLLVSGIGFLVVSSLAMALYVRERNAFEIRARSAYLSLLNGICYMAVLVIIVVRQLPEIFLQLEVNIYAIFTVYFFASVCNACCYGSRTIRLAVLYSPRARRAAPWLLSERNHVIACLLLGAASTAVPLYDMTQVSDGPLRELEYYLLVKDHLWIGLLGTQAVVLLLNPIAWYIDDIFGVGPELRAMMVVQIIARLTGRLAEEYAAPDLLRWINSQKLAFVSLVIMVSISIISPIRRRLLHPLQSTDPKIVKVLARRKAMAAKKGTSVGPSESGRRPASDEEGGSFFSSSMSSTAQPNSAGNSPGSWTYEKVMKRPEVAAAFEGFSRKALCQESFLFLKDATTFQAQSSVEAEFADDSKSNGESGSGNNADGKPGGGSDGNTAAARHEQFMFFVRIVNEYIADGSPNEINISSKDKNIILDVYNNKRRGDLGFRDLPAAERRLIFARAYAEVRFMLESNLMLKFISTDEFDQAITASRQKQPRP